MYVFKIINNFSKGEISTLYVVSVSFATSCAASTWEKFALEVTFYQEFFTFWTTVKTGPALPSEISTRSRNLLKTLVGLQ